MTRKEREGLRTLRKRVKEKEVVICRTDKSGKFGVVEYGKYIEMMRNVIGDD